MFCYTSGTTGDPKAAMLSHGNMIAAVRGAKDADLNITDEDSHISYLPLAHSFEKIVFAMNLFVGGKYGFYSGDPLKLLDDMQTLQPTIFISVPRLFNRIYETVHSRLLMKSKAEQWFFNRAMSSK
jgi:long-chain acyl-CoA synthetase